MKNNMWVKGDRKIIIAGHRGAKALAPENTMPSFEKAVELGVHGLETDVWMTKDGVLMLMHDGDVSRTTNATGSIRDYTYNEIREFDAGIKFSEEYKGVKVPTFDEFLEFVKGKDLMLNVEIKDNRKEVIDKVIKRLSQMNFDDTFLINSWNGETTTYAYKKYGVKTHGYPREYYPDFRDEFHEGMYSIGINMKDLTREMCEEYSLMGIEPWCWCPDTKDAVEYAISCGAILATVNDPRPAIEINSLK